MTVDHGMNPDEVRATAASLTTSADSLRALTQSLQHLVERATWVGRDADRFKHDWWPGHRARLVQIVEELSGFADSARNNAEDQERASGVDQSAAESSHSNSQLVPSSGRSTQSPTMTPIANDAGAGAPPLGGTEHELRSGFLAAWRRQPSGFDQWNFGYDNDGDSRFGNCTSYVAWRLNELARDQGLGPNFFSNNHLGDTAGLRFGNASEWGVQAGKIGHSATSEPAAGSVAWWDGSTPLGSYGHVAVVRSVEPNGSIVVEQSAWDTYDLKIETISPTSPRYPTGFLHLLPSR